MSIARPQAVVIGASAGALEALSAVLPELPRGFGLPVFVVVHLPPDKKSVLSSLFQAKCQIPVFEAEDKAPIGGGAIYFAPPNYHMLIEADRSLSLSTDEPVLFSRPAIDVLFESAADAYGAALVGVILTGANDDGARGLRAIADVSGIAVVQDPAQAFASAMPEAALAACPGARVSSLGEIAAFLQAL
jgi:two-component system, chemotaxis family, protein-glutamate methylesterase/glutaminase